MNFTPLSGNNRSLSERVYLFLKEAILSLALQPGGRIDKKALAKEIGVSLFPVSDAIMRLVNEGLIDISPQVGTYVTPFLMSDILKGSFLREALEAAAVERVAELITEDQISELRRNIRIQEVMVNEGDSYGFLKADVDMHEILLRATGFPKLINLTETVWLQAERARRLIVETPGRTLDGLNEHRVIVEAVIAGDPQGARMGMKRHLSRVADDLRELEHSHPELFAPSSARGRTRA